MNTSARVLLLNGSPKATGSNSGSLGAYLLERLAELGMTTERLRVLDAVRSEDAMKHLLKALDVADIIVLSSPLYTDAFPASVVSVMEKVAAHRRAGPTPAKSQRLLVLVNGAFPDVGHNTLALAIGRRFAREVGFEWAGGLALGMGDLLQGRPLKSAGTAFRKTCRALELTALALAREGASDVSAGEGDPSVPVSLYKASRWLRWRERALLEGGWRHLRQAPYQRKR